MSERIDMAALVGLIVLSAMALVGAIVLTVVGKSVPQGMLFLASSGVGAIGGALGNQTLKSMANASHSSSTPVPPQE